MVNKTMVIIMVEKIVDPVFMEALFFVAKFEEKFLELAALLRKLRVNSPAEFKLLISIPQLGRRKAYYLMSIQKAFGGYPHLRERLVNVGWTRLAFVAPYVTEFNVEEALLFAELNSAWALQQALKGKELPIGTRSVLLRFTPEQFVFFSEAILKHGAEKNGEGFVHKEEAIVAALHKAEP